jgi:sugar-specific transcriptional regulator TrmB
MINSTEYIRLISFLKNFDCNHREASTYIECLQMGTGSVQEIARRLNSNRVTIHSTIEQLIKKGLLFETIKGKKRLIAAESPDVLFRILQRKSNELKLIEKELEQTAKLLYSVQSPGRNSWNVKVYENEDGFKKILEETLSAKNSISVFTSSKILANVPPTYFNDYYKRLSESNIYSRIICPPQYAETFKEVQLQNKIQFKPSTSLNQFQISCFIWNDQLALITCPDEQLICTVIQSPELVVFFRDFLFEKIWKQVDAAV